MGLGLILYSAPLRKMGPSSLTSKLLHWYFYLVYKPRVTYTGLFPGGGIFFGIHVSVRDKFYPPV